MSSRELETVLLSLGSNIDPAANLAAATRQLGTRVEILAASHIYETAPIEATGTSLFLNAALMIGTSVTPFELKFEILRPLEALLGRVRTEDPNAARPIDMDISLFGNRIIDDPGKQLKIPDPEILTRAHVAIPLAEVAPDVVHPSTGSRLSEIAAGFSSQDIHMRHDLDLWPGSDRFA